MLRMSLTLLTREHKLESGVGLWPGLQGLQQIMAQRDTKLAKETDYICWDVFSWLTEGLNYRKEALDIAPWCQGAEMASSLCFSWTSPHVCKMATTVEVVVFLHNHIHRQVTGTVRVIKQGLLECLFPFIREQKNVSQAFKQILP